MALTKDGFKIEKAGNVATLTYENDNAFFEDTELSKKDIKAVFDYAHEYIETSAEVASVVSVDIMDDDKAIDEVIIKLPYGVSKRGSVDIRAKRTVTFPGINGNNDVTRSDLRVVVKDPLTKVPKTKLKDLQAKMTESLLK